LGKIAVIDKLQKALAERALTGEDGCAVAHTIAAGPGMRVADVICTSGPNDTPFEEKVDHVSIAIVAAGTFKYRSRRGSVLLSPGSLLLGNVAENFECSHEYGCGDRCISFQYEPGYFERIAADAGAKGAALSFPVARLPALSSLTWLTAETRVGLALPHEVNFEELGLLLAAGVLGALAGLSLASIKPPTRQDERRIATALHFIDERFSETLRLEEIATSVGFGPYHFLRTFKGVVGLTPHQFLLRRRLREAALLLRTTRLSVMEIALDAGFGDLSHFNHTFRATFDTTPTKYRKKYSKASSTH
jgi:AraC family transcriptional regulator